MFQAFERYGGDYMMSEKYTGGLIREEEEEEMELESGGGDDDSDDSDSSLPDAEVEQFVFPEPEDVLVRNMTNQTVQFPRDRIPKKFPKISTVVLNAMNQIPHASEQMKTVLCVHMCMPMPVPSSPLVAFLLAREQQQTKTQRNMYTSWTHSMFELKTLMECTRQGVFPFDTSVTTDYLEQCLETFQQQMRKFELMQDDRVQKLLQEIARETQQQHEVHERMLISFISYLEEYSMYYLHSLERYLYQTLVLPRACAAHIKLEHVLTPSMPFLQLNMCGARKYMIRKDCVEFFQIKVLAFQKYQEQEEHEFCPMDLQQLPHRIEVHPQSQTVRYNCPANDVYNGYITRMTLKEYLLLCDTENVLNSSSFHF